MNLTSIIIEDQAPAQRILKKFITDLSFIELKATFSDATKALDFLNSEEVDLIFLDIHLPKMSGIDFLKIKPKNTVEKPLYRGQPPYITPSIII